MNNSWGFGKLNQKVIDANLADQQVLDLENWTKKSEICINSLDKEMMDHEVMDQKVAHEKVLGKEALYPEDLGKDVLDREVLYQKLLDQEV